jgi:hypothetical protein
MYEAQSVPAVPEPSPSRSLHWAWSGLAGVVVGAAVASGVFWFVMHQQEQRHQAELAAVAAGTVNPAGLLAQAGELFSGAGQSSAPAKIDTTPTKEEIAAYLDGKTLPLPEADNTILNAGEKSSKTCTMTKDGVEAVQKGSTWTSGGDPSTTSIVVLYKTADARYAVDAILQHKPVGDTSAFFGPPRVRDPRCRRRLSPRPSCWPGPALGGGP